MMEVKAVIRPNKLPALRSALLETSGFPGMTVTKVEGCNAPSKNTKSSIKDELTDYSAKIKIEIICNDEIANTLMDKIVAICQSGHMSEAVVWCTPVPKAFFIAKSTS